MKNAAIAMVLGVLGLTGCRVHTLEDGPFTLTVQETLRDDCGWASQNVLPTEGTLRTEGHQVQLALDRPAMRLVGTYRYSLEEATLDGAQVDTVMRLSGQDCRFDSLTTHLDLTTTDANRFTGTLSMVSVSTTDDRCSCRTFVRIAGQAR